MEKRPATPPPPDLDPDPEEPSEPSPPPLSPGELEALLDALRSLPSSPSADPLPLVRSLLLNLPRRDLPPHLRPLLLLALQDLPLLLPPRPSLLPLLASTLPRLPADLLPSALPAFTALFVLLPRAPSPLSRFTSHLLSRAALRSHSPRALVLDSLRELESAFPLLLSAAAPYLWSLCLNDRSPATQHAFLLLATVALNASLHASPSPLLAASSSLPDPFCDPGCPPPSPAAPDLHARDVSKLLSSFLEHSHLFTPLALVRMLSLLARALDAVGLRANVAALVRVHLSPLAYTFDPALCHLALSARLRFPSAFSPADDRRLALRLARVASEPQHPLAFRLLALRWLLGLAASSLVDLSPLLPRLYPAVYDPLALKAAKLDALAYAATRHPGDPNTIDVNVSAVIADGLVCVNAFEWLPACSTETVIAFRMLRSFLLGVMPHSAPRLGPYPGIREMVESSAFQSLQTMLVDLALRCRGLVPVIACFVDRLMACEAHRAAGELLLHRMDGHLLGKLPITYMLSWYFPIFERISGNVSIPPHSLLELLIKYIVFLVEKHGPKTSMLSWEEGSKVLGICRVMLMHHHSSRVFHLLSRLLAYTCRSFPDLEVRDNARICLRMLLCIPGKKLRDILNFGNETLGVLPSQHPGSLFQIATPRPSQSHKKFTGISSYIHVERVTPLLVKQSWSLAIMPILGIGESYSFEGIKDPDTHDSNKVQMGNGPSHGSSGLDSEETTGGAEIIIGSSANPLRVTDSRVAEIVGILRKHFACIPDYRHMSGFKIKIPCMLWFESEPFCRAWGIDQPAGNSEVLSELPAFYASVVKLSSASKYGSIPMQRVPFLLGEPSGTNLSIVLAGDAPRGRSRFRASIIVELEPREPAPGMVNVVIEANIENGQVISGPLQDVVVGIEDMFMKTCVPPDLPEDLIAGYYLDLFNALWEACGDPASVGRETFLLKGGKGIASISGTKSVKIFEVPALSLIHSIERYLAAFVVQVRGNWLIDLVREKGIIEDVIWTEDSFVDATNSSNDALVPYSGSRNPLQLTYYDDTGEGDDDLHHKNTSLGYFHLLIFLPPRFHLLFQFEVCHSSTTVWIRTDHWPCLAYVDEYLEALFLK